MPFATTLLFMYQLFYRRQPRWSALIVLLSAALAAYSLLDIQRAAWLFLLAAIVPSAEELRVVRLAIYRRRPGAWIVGLGLAALALSSGYIMVAETGFLPLLEGQQELVPLASLLALVFGMSVFLSRRFSQT